jgi:hypothetical protein
MGNRTRNGISRREFARRAAIASAAVLVPPATLAAQPSAGSAVLQASEQPTSAPQLAPESQAEAEARYQAILHAYGSRLSDQQKTDLHRMSLEAQPALDRIRAYHLENSDNPALYLKPLVEREKKPVVANPVSAGAAPAKKS